MRAKGFSLLELLISISVIGMLTAIIMPTLQVVRARARDLCCAANTRQLSVLMSMYESTNGHYPPGIDNSLKQSPPPSGYAGDAAHDRMGWWWFNYLGLHDKHIDSKEKGLLLCPSRSLRGWRFNQNILVGSYGVNNSICRNPLEYSFRKEFRGKSLSSSQVVSPSRTALLMDSGYSIIGWWHASTFPPHEFVRPIGARAYVPGLSINQTREIYDDCKEDAVYGRHTNKSINVAFVDGHVSRETAESLLVEQDSSGSYTNLEPLWISK